MFTQQYVDQVHHLLQNSLDERGTDKNLHEIEWNANAMKIVWEPGDMTRYTAYALVVPDGREDFAVVVTGTITNVPFMMFGTPEGFVSLSYFLEKNNGLPKHNLYTHRKLCQLVSAAMLAETDANDPIDYAGS